MTFVEGDIPRVGRLEVGRHLVAVDELEAVPQQLAAEALALLCTVDTEPRQVPMRERRVGGIPLFEQREEIDPLFGGETLPDLREDGLAVGLHVRREPQGHGIELTETPYRLGRERLATERAK